MKKIDNPNNPKIIVSRENPFRTRLEEVFDKFSPYSSLGEYNIDSDEIWLRKGMPNELQYSTLIHELRHREIERSGEFLSYRGVRAFKKSFSTVIAVYLLSGFLMPISVYLIPLDLLYLMPIPLFLWASIALYITLKFRSIYLALIRKVEDKARGIK